MISRILLPDWHLNSYVEITLIGILGIYALLWVSLQSTQDAREPRAMDTSIPFISPLINMVMRGSTYFQSRSSEPIYTLRLPGARLYIVNSTSLIPPVQRKSQTISFAPILVQVAAGIIGFSRSGMDVVGKDPTDEHSLLETSARNNTLTLTPGPRLHELNQSATRHISQSLDELKAAGKGKGESVLRLHEWVSRTIIKTSTETMYGPMNPFRDERNIGIWQEFGAGFVPLIVNVLPQLLARKSVLARAKLVKCFEEYFQKQGHTHPEASALVRNRHALFHERGLSASDIARHEVGTSLALLINTIPATFWFVYHLFADASLLRICREELSRGVVTAGEQGQGQGQGQGRQSVELAFIKTACPTFLSAFKETLRFHGVNVAARVVVEDTLINEAYLLKKGGILLIPGAVQHALPSIWGEDAGEFNAARFLTKRRHNPAAFRVFGGGSVVCPGRYFATTEILALAALMVLRFDVRPCGGEGEGEGRREWVMPTVHKTNPGISFQQPDEDVEVQVQARDACQWEIVVSRPDETAGMTSLGDVTVTNV
ncbi:cytochrome P450 [Xylaria sp. CBS 124048]|nr:cytochrome P450 [Xylaria sp. CBS 124048]